MPSHQHKILLKQIQELTLEPSDLDAYERWISASDQLALLQNNVRTDELIIHASGPHFFVHTVSICKDVLSPLDQEDLLNWSDNPYKSRAFYDSEHKNAKVQIRESGSSLGSTTSEQTQQLIFMRQFDGVSGEPPYCGVLQEYLHLSEIHWSNEHSSFCRFDENGDFDHVVSFTPREDVNEVTLVSFKREPLELYLAASNSVLVRMFDFTLSRLHKFSRWPDQPESLRLENDMLFYAQRIDPGKAGYVRGIQFVPLSRSDDEIFSIQRARFYGEKEGPWVEFEVYDFRNKRNTTVSTDPSTTTTYFAAKENSLPYETSPAFFRAEVLAKYKTDREKYVVDEVSRSISCRNVWELRRFDVNEAGQVHAYVCYLRDLPCKEQMYWRSFNEAPKDNISKRAFEHDIMGEWSPIPDPLSDLLSAVEQWHHKRVSWWKLKDNNLFNHITTPHSPSRDEWAQAFMDLSHLIIEGFVHKAIKQELNTMGVTYKTEGSLVLLEKLLVAKCLLPQDKKLEGLKTTSFIRSKVKAHAGSTQAKEFVTDALLSHGSYADHFRYVCDTIAKEIQLIEQAFDSP